MPRKKNRPELKLKPRLHIFCEGEKTEPNYLKGYIDQIFPGIRLIVVEKTKKNTPVQLVKEAIEAKENNPPGDIFWVAYDRESTIKYKHALHAEARQKAATNIHIALSNVCFEVWLLLHFQNSSAPYTSCTELLKKSKLKTYIKHYDKANNRTYSHGEIAFARKNAERMNTQTKRGANSLKHCHQWNPYTDFYKLLDAIDAFGKKHI